MVSQIHVQPHVLGLFNIMCNTQVDPKKTRLRLDSVDYIVQQRTNRIGGHKVLLKDLCERVALLRRLRVRAEVRLVSKHM